MTPLFAPSPADRASQAFFGLLLLIAVVTVSNGFAALTGVSLEAPALARAAATTTTLLF